MKHNCKIKQNGGGDIFILQHNEKPCSVIGLYCLGSGVRGPQRTTL